MTTKSTTSTATAAGDAKPDPALLINQVLSGLGDTANEVVPWYVSQMPLMYFQDTDPDVQIEHLRAIIAAKASGRPLEMTLRSEDGTEWTSMRPHDKCGVLAELVRELPTDLPLRSAKIHTTLDGQLVVDTFEFGEAPRFNAEDPTQAEKFEQVLEYARDNMPDADPASLTEYVRNCPADYVETVTPLRICRHWELLTQVSGTDGTIVSLEPERDPTVCRIVVGASNASTRSMMERIARLLSRVHVNIHRAYLDQINDGHNGSISMLGFVVQGPDGKPLEKESELWNELRRDLLRLKWVDDAVLDLIERHGSLDLIHAEIISALDALAHQVLVKENPFAFDLDRIIAYVDRNIEIAERISDLLLERFNPDHPMADETFDRLCGELEELIDNDVDFAEARAVFHKMLDGVKAVYRTNIYLENRFALSLRIDPTYLRTEDRPEVPFGVFFVHGRSFNGFHVRFRDIARGGVRAVRPIGDDQHARESERLYDEAYQLAFAQQLKNKDIPEGGAKAAILLEPNTKVGRSVKGFVDSLIDLITPDPETRRFVVDRFGQEELLYLGPDENITPELINWIVDRARRRGYPLPTALMSSKPGAGINHKEFGVTSEGVAVFLDVALRSVGINPNEETFTVKITGGPDGDVGGNCLLILDREYGANAKVIGIADGSGVGEDPAGLNHEELIRLVHEGLPIASFDRSKLSKNGRIVSVDEPDGVHLRNTLHNRLVADAFVPCGGRPAAINESNWQEYLQSDGTPSSRVIVEGANLFLTPDARIHLSDAGALILKDSSANKCGVICSSYEIISCMLLSESEFIENKEVFVSQVLDKLRVLARREAELLLRINTHMPDVPLPVVSIRLSDVSIRTSDAIESAIDELLKTDDGDLLRQLVVEHLPPILMEKAGDRIWSQMPERYLKWIMAKSLATRMVYREGFEYLESMPRELIAHLAVRYLRLELERKQLQDEVTSSSLPNKERISALLDQAGILSTMMGESN